MIDPPAAFKGALVLLLTATTLPALTLSHARAAPGDDRQQPRSAATATAEDSGAAGALRALLEKARRDPAPTVVREIARTYSRARQIDESIKWYRIYLRGAPDDVRTLLELTSMLSASRDKRHHQEAMRQLNEFLARRPRCWEARLQRARLSGWMGKTSAAKEDFSLFLASHPTAEDVRMELAEVLSWSKNKSHVRMAVAMFDAHLKNYPLDDAVLLRRARAHSWIGMTAEAIADFTKYLEKHPKEDSVRLQLADALSWSADRRHLARAIVLFDAYLSQHPSNDAVLLRRARAKSWSGMTEAAIADFDTYLNRHPSDGKALLDFGNAAMQIEDRRRWRRAVALIDRHLEGHPADVSLRHLRGKLRSKLGDPSGAVADLRLVLSHTERLDVKLDLARALIEARREADALALFSRTGGAPSVDDRIGRALALRWSDHHAQAEAQLSQLSRLPLSAEQRRIVSLELARIYWETNRQGEALEQANAVLSQEPTNSEAAWFREQLRAFFRPSTTPEFLLYRDSNDTLSFSVGCLAKVSLSHAVDLTFAAAAWRLSRLENDIWAELVDVGSKIRLSRYFDLEAALGPRLTHHQSTSVSVGGHLAARLRPLQWMNLTLSSAYDLLYRHSFQPETAIDGVRGLMVEGGLELKLPLLEATLSGSTTARFVLPENSSVGATGTFMVPFLKILSAGYFFQYLAWRDNVPSYWSPQEYFAHMFVAGVMQKFDRFGLDYSLQGTVGVARERVEGTPERGYSLAYGGSFSVSYQPVPRINLRAALQFGQSVREIIDPNTGLANPFNGFWWLMSQFFVTVVF